MKKIKITRRVGRRKQHEAFLKKVRLKMETHSELIDFLQKQSSISDKDEILNHLKRITQTATDYLIKRNLPHEIKYHHFEIIKDGVEIEGGAHLPEIIKQISNNPGIELEPEWYAANIIAHADDLSKHINSNNLLGSVKSAVLMEKARGDFNFSTFEPLMRAGVSRTSSASKQKIDGARNNQKLAKPIFNSYLTKGFSRSRAAERTSLKINETHGLSIASRTIREWKTKKLI